jgi:hypothetical protein
MPRIRSIKPEFFQHADLYDAEAESGLPLRIAFIGLWTQCDREGRFEWRPRQLKLNTLPYDECDFSAVMDTLEKHGFVERYEVDGKVYGCVPSWLRHQCPNSREPSSTIPAQYQDSTGTVPARVEGKGKEGKGKEQAQDEPARDDPLPDGLNPEVWQRWMDYRKQLRRPLKPVSIPAAQRELAAFGAEQAAVVEQSVANGWQGLFALKPKSANGKPPERRIETPPTPDQVEAARRKAAADNAALHAKLAGVIGRVA